ncbi:MAG: FAD-dependent oxidoreductase, partial [Polyangiaceae bacterium]
MKADVIVVGAGIAGLVTALGVADAGCTTIVLCKGKLGEIAATAWAQGGIAAALGEDDAPIFHARDTLQAAAGIADPKIVAVLTEEAPAAIELLVRTGVEFDRDASGNLFLGREAAHAHRRIVHAGG